MKKQLFLIITCLQVAKISNALLLRGRARISQTAQSTSNTAMTSNAAMSGASHRFKTLDESYIELLEILIKNGDINKVKNILKETDLDSNFSELLNISIKNNSYELAQLLINNIKSNSIPFQPLQNAVENGNEKLVKILLASGKFKNVDLSFYIPLAYEHKEKSIIHILKAYDALKRNLDLKKLSLVDRKFYDAYQKFINGDANDLRNLIFPVSKKVDSKKGTTTYIYAIFPKENSESAAIKIISESLVKIFKPGYIRSLILTLVETNAQKESAQDLLKVMKLTKEDLKEFFKDNVPSNIPTQYDEDFYSYNDKNLDLYSYLDVQDNQSKNDKSDDDFYSLYDFYSHADENDFYSNLDEDSEQKEDDDFYSDLDDDDLYNSDDFYNSSNNDDDDSF